MASQVSNTFGQSEGETASPFNFDQWVEESNLLSIKHLLIKYNMTQPATLKMTSLQYPQLMSDNQVLTQPQIIPVLIGALRKVTESISKVIRIYISKEEEEAMRRLKEYKNKISQMKQQIEIKSEEFSKMVTACKANIEDTFTKLITKIQAKKQQIIEELAQIATGKRNEIKAKLDNLNGRRQIAHNASLKCISLQDDTALDQSKRKHKVIAIVDGVTSSPVPGITDADCWVSLEVRQESIDPFIDNLTLLQQAIVPIISKVKCNSITDTQATIQFSATLSEEHRERKAFSDVWIKLQSANPDLDEKEQERANISPMSVQFDAERTKYDFKLRSLTPATTYKLCLLAYNDRNGSIKGFQAIPVEFTTKHLRFSYKSDFDENGICYYFGTLFGEKAWSNPGQAGLITLQSSGWESSCDINNVLQRGGYKGDSYANPCANAWLSIDFGPKWKIQATHYTLRHDQSGSSFLRHWNFEGSNDGKSWTILKEHRGDESLNDAYATRTWSLDTNESYQIFRVCMTGRDSNGSRYLLCAGFEIYGNLIRQQ